MKLNIKSSYFAYLLLAALALGSGCGDEATLDGTIVPADGARVRFINAVTGGAAYRVFANDKIFSASYNVARPNGPDSIANGSVYPANDYALWTAGTVNFKAKLPLSVNPRDTTIAQGSTTLENGKYYLAVAADTSPSTKFFFVPEDRSVAKNGTKTYFRCINAITGAPAGFEFWLKRKKDGPIGTVKFGEATTYLEFDPTGSATDTIAIRRPGSTTDYSVFSAGTTKLNANRITNIVIRGVDGPTFRMGVASFVTSN